MDTERIPGVGSESRLRKERRKDLVGVPKARIECIQLISGSNPAVYIYFFVARFTVGAQQRVAQSKASFAVSNGEKITCTGRSHRIVSHAREINIISASWHTLWSAEFAWRASGFTSGMLLTDRLLTCDPVMRLFYQMKDVDGMGGC